MKIASVTFSPARANIGGAAIPALAFQEWARIAGAKCDLIGVHENQGYSTFLVLDDSITYKELDKLNQYDAVFLATPPLGCTIEDINRLKTKFIFMVHGEGDLDLYGEDIIKHLLSMPNCLGIAHIVYGGNANVIVGHIIPPDVPEFFWYPCCRPNALVRDQDKIARTTNGLLYAARIRNWLNPNCFMGLSAYLNEDQNHNILMMGPCAKEEKRQHLIKYNKESGLEIPIIFGAFRQEDKYQTNTNVFWDVAGTPTRAIKTTRLSLSGWEALYRGFMPIVSKEHVPKYLKGLILEYDFNNPQQAAKDIQQYWDSSRLQKNRIFDNIFNSLKKRGIGYFGVKDQVDNILNRLMTGIRTNNLLPETEPMGNTDEKIDKVEISCMESTCLSDIMIESNNLFASRNKEYANAFEKHGVVIQSFFPDGIVLRNEDDMKRYGLVNAIANKLVRYCRNFDKGHPDSIQDLAVYAHMLDYVDRKGGKNG